PPLPSLRNRESELSIRVNPRFRFCKEIDPNTPKSGKIQTHNSRRCPRQSPLPAVFHGRLTNATHKHAKVKAWLKRHTRFHLHFTPTSASWTNLAERFFGLITEDAIRRGIFRSVGDLKLAIENYLDHHNADPKPFIWTAKAADILKKIARGRQVLES